tara:strand:+ start:535 stop:714 length:180 start_codon:yes stop_codon:yes gene_type:complete
MTEQDVIDLFFPDDNTKTISDVITHITQLQIDNGWSDCTETDTKTSLKDNLTDVSDWSF